MKPHELELMSAPMDDEEDVENDNFSESDEERKKKGAAKKQKKAPPKVLDDSSYSDVYNSFSTAIESINTIVNNSKTSAKPKKKIKSEQPVPSRPKMIHTQKTRVPVESADGGKVRHKTRTLVTRTQPTELKSATGERIRPRTKNVSYHIYNSDKMQVATFPEDDIAVNNLLASDMNSVGSSHDQSNGTVHFEQSSSMDVGSEQTVETEPEPEPVGIIKVTKTRAVKKSNNSLKPGRHLIGPGDKVVRIVKGGMLVSKKRRKDDEPEGIFPDVNPVEFKQEVKQEDPSALHELAEISMQHAQNMFKCEMCSEVFSDRSQLLVHVPIHI